MSIPAPPPYAGIPSAVENNSGGGQAITVPPGVAGWSWGAFLLNWIWAIGNQVWIGLLALVPYVGFVVAIWLGIKGREMAWRSRRWASFEEFERVQKKWSWWGVVVFLVLAGIAVLGIVTAILLPILAKGGSGG